MPQVRYALFNASKFDLLKGILIQDNKEVQLEPKIQAFLTLLVESNGAVLDRKQLLTSLWDDPDKAEERLRALVKKTREALGDSARSPHYIKTIPKQGYRFLPEVEFENDVEDVKSSPIVKWAGIVGACFLVYALIVIMLGTSSDKDGLDDAFTVIEERMQEIQRDERAYIIDEDRLYILSNDENILTASWSSETEYDLRLELNDKTLLFEGLSINKQNAYIVTRSDIAVEFTFWSIADSETPELRTIDLPELPADVVLFDSKRGDIYFSVSRETSQELVKVNVSEPALTNSLLTDMDKNLDGIFINEELNQVVTYSSNFVSTLVTIFDLVSGLNQTQMFNFPVTDMLSSGAPNGLLFRDDHERLYGFNFDSRNLTLWHSKLQNNDKLIGVCGYNCVMVNRKAESFDIYQQALLDVNSNDLTSLDQMSTSSSVSSMVSFDSKVLLSSYSADGINITQIHTGQHHLSAELDSLQSVGYLILNHTGTLLVGSEAERLFAFDLISGDFRWLDISMSKVGFPQFDPNNDNLLYFTSLDPRFDISVFKYDLSNDIYERVSSNVVLNIPLSESVKLELSEDGKLTIKTADTILFERTLRSYDELRIYPNMVSFLDAETLDIFNVEGKQVTQYQRPSLFDTDIFDIDVKNGKFTFASMKSEQSAIIKMYQIEKSY